MLLEMEGVTKTYPGPDGEVRALDGVSLRVDGGEFVAVRGPSGSGKTTLLLAAGGLLVPTAGRVAVGGQELYGISPEKRARFRATTVGFVFQQFHLIPYLSVLDNVLAPSLAAPAPDAAARAGELLARFNLQDRIQHVPGELSTGERQRTALARALLNRPRLLLADEPTGNLDEDNSEVVLGCLKEFAEGGGAVLLVTHDARAAASAQRVAPMEKGRIVG